MKKSKLKFTLVVHELGVTKGHGGIATYALSRALYLKEHGHQVSLICYEASFDPSTKKIFRDINFIPRGLSIFETSIWVSDLLEKTNPDVVETSDYLGWLSDYLVRLKLGFIENNTWVDVRHHTASREIYEWNHFEDISLAPYETQLTHRYELIQQRLANRNTFPSNFLENYLNQYESISNSHIEAYPIQIKEMHNSKRTRELKTKVHVVSFGRIEKRKGLIHLVNALNDLSSPISLSIVGNTLYENNGETHRRILSNSMTDKLLNQTNFIEFIEPEKFKSFFDSADIFIIPSPFENFPYAAIEGILHGVPIIASRYSGLADILGSDLHIFDPFVEGSLKKVIRNTMDLWAAGKLHELALKQYMAYVDYLNKYKCQEISFKIEDRIQTKVEAWRLESKFPSLNTGDSLLISGRESTEYFPTNLSMVRNATEMLVALSAKAEAFIDMETILQRQIPFLIPLLTQGEIVEIMENRMLGILKVMENRPKVVSFTHSISNQPTGLQLEYFGAKKSAFLNQRRTL